MTIQQAIAQAYTDGLCVTRDASPWKHGFLKLKKSGEKSPLALCNCDGKSCGRGWQPQINDILADDWGICD